MDKELSETAIPRLRGSVVPAARAVQAPETVHSSSLDASTDRFVRPSAKTSPRLGEWLPEQIPLLSLMSICV